MKEVEAKAILEKIKEYDTVVISRHINPDPDCLGAQLTLKSIIKRLFPEKKVYAVGKSANHLEYLGELDTLPDIDTTKALAIILDTPDKKRVYKIAVADYAYSIKIDHHPFDHKYCDYEVIADDTSSVCELITIFCWLLDIELTKKEAERLYTGIISDTERYLSVYTNPNTFSTALYLVKKFNVDITKTYRNLYLRPLNDYKIIGYIYNNIKVTEAGAAYIKLTRKWILENNIDTQIVGKIANCLNYIEEIIAWCIIVEEENEIRISLRSRGPIVSTIASRYGGGGHKYISGVSLKTEKEVDKVINELNEICNKYKENN